MNLFALINWTIASIECKFDSVALEIMPSGNETGSVMSGDIFMGVALNSLAILG